MSAVATVLGLMLIVLFISTFILQQLPSQMAEVEFEHALQVENQLSRLQATVLAEALHPGVNLRLASPVTLGSGSLPPFGAPSSGSLQAEPSTLNSFSWFSEGQVFATPPRWGQGTDPCASGNSSGLCSSNGNIQYWNFTGLNGSTLNIKVTGGNNGLVYNFTGNNDTINVNWLGKDTQFIRAIINGSDNIVNYNKGGSDTGAPVTQWLFYGERNTFNFNPSGSHSSGGSMTVYVQFVGTLTGTTCPYANASLTNQVGTLGTGGSNLNVTVVWYDSVGYATKPHTVAYPGGFLPTEMLTWQNRTTGFLPCAFTTTYASSYTAGFQGGLDVHLNNRYSPQADVAYESGAVLLAESGGAAIMVSPPAINISKSAIGFVGRITLIDLLTNVSVEGGIQTAGVTSQVTGIQTVLLHPSGTSFYLVSPFFFNVSTTFPTAWINYINGNPNVFPTGASCVPFKAIPAPFTCARPPPGVAVEVSTALEVQALTVTIITANVSVT